MALSPELTEHLMRPRRAGALEAPGAVPIRSGTGENAACGDLLEVQARPGPDGLELAWRGTGCGAVLAVASLAAEALHGAAPDEVRAFDLAARVEQAGGLDRRSAHAVRVVQRALDGALGA